LLEDMGSSGQKPQQHFVCIVALIRLCIYMYIWVTGRVYCVVLLLYGTLALRACAGCAHCVWVFRLQNGNISCQSSTVGRCCWCPSATPSRLKSGSRRIARGWKERARVQEPRVSAFLSNSQICQRASNVSLEKDQHVSGAYLAGVIKAVNAGIASHTSDT